MGKCEIQYMFSAPRSSFCLTEIAITLTSKRIVLWTFWKALKTFSMSYTIDSLVLGSKTCSALEWRYAAQKRGSVLLFSGNPFTVRFVSWGEASENMLGWRHSSLWHCFFSAYQVPFDWRLSWVTPFFSQLLWNSFWQWEQ